MSTPSNSDLRNQVQTEIARLDNEQDGSDRQRYEAIAIVAERHLLNPLHVDHLLRQA